MDVKVALAVPCFNERGRLDIPAFAAGADRHDLRILFVDDGSTDGTADFIEEQIEGRPRLALLRSDRNRGKAAAVREGMRQLAGEFPETDWVGFWDADLSTPLEEISHMLAFHDLEGGGYDAIWASRVMRAGSCVERRFLRHLFGRILATMAGEMMGVRAYDTQCGAKIFRPSAVPVVCQKEFVSRWLFDLEMYLRLGHDRIVECPTLSWRDVPGSKISLLFDGPRVLFDMLRIRGKYGATGKTSCRLENNGQPMISEVKESK